MKIAFDHQVFTFQSYGGISRYIVHLAKGLLSLGESVDVLAPLHHNHYLKELPPERVHGFGINIFPPKSTGLIGTINREIASLQARQLQSEILHETYYAARPVKGTFKGRVLSVYDMIHEIFDSEFSPRDATSRFKREAISRADHIIAISHSTKRDLIQLIDVPFDKVSVVHLGFDSFERLKPENKEKSPTRPFLLYVGNRGGYKNFKSMLKAVASQASLKNAFDIVAFGGGSFNASEKKLINTLGFKPSAVRQIGGDDHVLGGLYNAAAAFVYPSLYEGFGLPPLEAMAHDCPVVTSNTSSMPEVVGAAGEYFNPTDIEAQAQAISHVVYDTLRRRQLIHEGRSRLGHFSWARCAAETRDIYASILGS